MKLLRFDPLLHPAFKVRETLDLAAATRIYKSAVIHEDNNEILTMTGRVAYYPLCLTVDGIILSLEEKQLSQPLFDAWLQKKRIEALPHPHPGKNHQKVSV